MKIRRKRDGWSEEATSENMEVGFSKLSVRKSDKLKIGYRLFKGET